MNETNGTGVEYPQLTLGGVTYTLKLTRGQLMYRFSKRNISMGLRVGQAGIAMLADQLHAMIQGAYFGSPEDLLEMILGEDKLKETANAVDEAIKKVFPPPIQAATAAAPADAPQAPVQ